LGLKNVRVKLKIREKKYTLFRFPGFFPGFLGFCDFSPVFFFSSYDLTNKIPVPVTKHPGFYTTEIPIFSPGNRNPRRARGRLPAAQFYNIRSGQRLFFVSQRLILFMFYDPGGRGGY